MMKLLVIGLDGLDWEYGQRAIPRRFRRLPLVSQIGLTGVEWTSMCSGVPANALGLYNFYQKYLGREKPGVQITYEHLAGYYWWEIAEAAGHSIGIWGPVACYPLRKPSNGWILGGLGSVTASAHWDCREYFLSSDRDQEPPPDPELSGDFARITAPRVGAQEDKNALVRWRRMMKGIGYEGFCSLVSSESEVATYYFKKNLPDVGFVYWRWLDIAVHYFAGAYAENPEPLNEVVQHWVWKLTDAADGAPVFVVGDHGGYKGHHRDVSIFAARDGIEYPLGLTQVDYGEPDRAASRWMFKANSVQSPYPLSTVDVAREVLKPLGLAPRKWDHKGETYKDDELDVVEKRLRDMGYF